MIYKNGSRLTFEIGQAKSGQYVAQNVVVQDFALNRANTAPQ